VTAQPPGGPPPGTAPSTGTGSPTGYALVLPPGWVRVPLRSGTDEVLAGILDRTFAGLPADRYGPLRSELEGRLRRQVRTARANGGLDLYLPVERVHGATLAASFVVAEVSFDDERAPAPAVLAALLGKDGDESVVTVGGTVAVRSQRTTVAAPRDEDELPGSRRVEYLVPVPGDGRRWVTLAFSTVAPSGDGPDDLAGVLTDLFDAVVTTFRWEHPARA
jgi:hypothetical protein